MPCCISVEIFLLESSQRMYIVNGPSEDIEEENEKSVTQLQSDRLHELKRKEELRVDDDESFISNRRENAFEDGIDWGMGEDADGERDMKASFRSVMADCEKYY